MKIELGDYTLECDIDPTLTLTSQAETNESADSQDTFKRQKHLQCKDRPILEHERERITMALARVIKNVPRLTYQ